MRESKAVSSMPGAGGLGSDSEENAGDCELGHSPDPFSGAGSDSPAYASSGGQDAEVGSPAGSDLHEQERGKIGDEEGGVEIGVDNGLDGAGQLESGGPAEEWEEAKNDSNGDLAEDEHAALAGGAGERSSDTAKGGALGQEESKTEVQQGLDGPLASEQGPEEEASASASPGPEEPAAQGAGAGTAEAAEALGAGAKATAAADISPAVSAAPALDAVALEGSPVAPLAVDDVAIAVDDVAIGLDNEAIAVDDMPVAVDALAIAVDGVSQAVESGEAKAPEGEGLDIAEGLAGGGRSGASAAVSAASSPEANSVAESPAESMESMIDALPPGFVRCPGCPMVSRCYRSRCPFMGYCIAAHRIAAHCIFFVLFSRVSNRRS